MAQHSKPKPSPIARRMSAESDILRSAYTINIHVSEDSIMHALVARMNLSSRRYQFTALPSVALSGLQPVYLGEAVALVADLIAQDAESEWYTA